MTYKLSLTRNDERDYEGLSIFFSGDNTLSIKRNYSFVELTVEEFHALYDLFEVLDQRLPASLVDAAVYTPDVTNSYDDETPF